MSQKIKKSSFARVSILVLTALFFLVGMNKVWALIGQGDIRVRVGTEISAAGSLKGNATVTIRCIGGTGSYSVTDQTASDSNTTPGIIDIASTAVGFTAANQADCITQNQGLTASVSLDGFVTSSISRSFGNRYTKTIAADTPNNGVASLSFTVHVNGVEDELGNVVTLNGTSASISYSNSNGATATVSYSGGKAYISASPSDTSPVASAGFNGYVNKQKLLTSTAISSTASLSAYFGTGGGSVTYTGSGLPFAYKFTVYDKGGDSTNNLIHGASVTAGNSGSVNCSESGTTGIYYCAVPAAHTGTTATATKVGYNAGTLTYTVRASNRAAQLTGNITPIRSGGGGGGQNYTLTFGTPTPTLTPTPTPSATPTPTLTPTPTPLISLTPTPAPILTPISAGPTPVSRGFTNLGVLKLKEGDTISASGSSDPDVYIVNAWGYKRLFLNPVIFKFYGHLGGFSKVKKIAVSTRDTLVTSGLFRNCETNDKKVYGLETTGEDTGILHWVNTTGAQAVADDPDFFKKVFCINSKELNWYKQSTPYTSISQIPLYIRIK